MSVGEVLFMVLVVGVAILVSVLKDKVPYWLGFVLMLAASIVAIAGSAATKNYKAIPLGIAGVLATIVAWISGATSQPATNDDGGGNDNDSRRRDDPDTLGGLATRIRWYAWLIIAGLLIGGVAVGLALPR